MSERIWHLEHDDGREWTKRELDGMFRNRTYRFLVDPCGKPVAVHELPGGHLGVSMGYADMVVVWE